MRRLVFIVVRARSREIRQQIEANNIVGFRILDFLAFRSLRINKRTKINHSLRHSAYLLERLVIFVVFEGEWLLASGDEPVQARVHNEGGKTIVGMRRTHVADFVQLLVHPRLLDVVLIIGDQQLHVSDLYNMTQGIRFAPIPISSPVLGKQPQPPAFQTS